MNYYIFAAYIAGLILIVGLILMLLEHHFQRKQSNGLAYFITNDMIQEANKVLNEVISNSMDMIPEKLVKLRNSMEENEKVE